MALNDGVVAYWKLDENTGSSAIDTVSSKTLTLNNTSWITGKINSALSFNGTTSSAVFGTPRVSNMGTFSIGGWIYTPGSNTGNCFYQDGNPTNANNLLLIYVKETGTNEIRVFNNGGNIITRAGDTNIPSNTWTHIVFTYTSNSFKYYRNGSLIQTWSVTVSNSGADNATFGRWNTQYFIGRMDELFIYNKVLTATEVTELYNSGNGLQYPFSEEQIESFNSLQIGDNL